MSQPPIPYATPNIPMPSNRPTILTVLAILGIVFGGLGVLCIGFSDIFQLLSLLNPHMMPATAAQPIPQKSVGLVMGVISLALCVVLLIGSIGAINLKPASRRLLVGWALADIAFDLARLLIVLVFFLPATANSPVFQQPAFQNNPNSKQIVAFAKVGGIVGGIVSWLFTTAFAVLLFIYYRRPETIAVFEMPPQNPNLPLPPPPI
jgi:hypothetical protein